MNDLFNCAQSPSDERRGTDAVLANILVDCACVLRTIDTDDSEESMRMAYLLASVDRAIVYLAKKDAS